MKYILLLAMFYQYSNAQISGRIISDGYPDIIIQTTLLQTGNKTEADLDGYFSIQIPDKLDKYDVLIEAGSMTFKIVNVTQTLRSIKMDTVELPTLKSISIDDYNKLVKIEKARYLPVYHWSNLLGYYDSFTLSRNYISFYCSGKEYQTAQFTFDPESRMISIDAMNIINCDK